MTKVTEKSTEELNLEAAIFGSESFQNYFEEDSETDDFALQAPIEQASHTTHDPEGLERLDDDQLFVVDHGEDEQMADLSSDRHVAHKGAAVDLGGSVDESREAAWQDSDDEKMNISLASASRLRKLRKTDDEDLVSGVEYARRLRAQFERVYPVPDWALPQQQRRKRRRPSEGSDSEEASVDAMSVALSADPLAMLLKTSKSYISAAKASVKAPGKLMIKRLRDANHQSPSQSAIQTMSFHPHFPLLVTGGFDRTLRIYHIDGKLNTPASSLYLKDVPVEHAHFHPDGKSVFIGGRRKYFHIWNLESGMVEKISRLYGHEGMQGQIQQFSLSPDGSHIALVGTGGWVNILAASTGQWIDAFKITRSVSDIVWHKNGNLTVANIGADIWEYSLQARQVIHRWQDDGGLDTTKIALGGVDDRWFAVGSKSGIVNLYDRKSLEFSDKRKPRKSFQHITTAIHDLQFSPDGQILAMSSRSKKDVLKMVHLPSCTIYQNWPTQSTPLGKIGAITFSPRSEMFSIGNEAGRVTLWSM